MFLNLNTPCLLCFQYDVQRFEYGKLRFGMRGFFVVKSKASERATHSGLAKSSNFLDTVL